MSAADAEQGSGRRTSWLARTVCFAAGVVLGPCASLPFYLAASLVLHSDDPYCNPDVSFGRLLESILEDTDYDRRRTSPKDLAWLDRNRDGITEAFRVDVVSRRSSDFEYALHSTPDWSSRSRSAGTARGSRAGWHEAGRADARAQPPERSSHSAGISVTGIT